MQNKHEPRDEFVKRLEWHVTAEARRRNRPVLQPRWARWVSMSPLRMTMAVAAIVVVSMAAGGAVVAAAYQSQVNERRDLVAAAYEQRLALAQQRLSLAVEGLNGIKRRVAVGLATNRELMEEQFKVVEAEAEVKTTQLQLEEVRLTAQDVVTTMSAPMVRGRDFVTERWQAEMAVATFALDKEKTLLEDVQRRVQIGVVDPAEVEVSRAKVGELEAALQARQRKLDIRKRFLNREFDATRADLRGLEVDAELRQRTLRLQLDLAKRETDRVAARVQKGIASGVDEMQARLKLLSLTAEAAKTEMDLALIRKRLEGKNP